MKNLLKIALFIMLLAFMMIGFIACDKAFDISVSLTPGENENDPLDVTISINNGNSSNTQKPEEK